MGVLDGFEDHRVNPERALSILKLVALEGITPNTGYVEDQEEQQSLNKDRSRRSNFTFSSVEIPVGTVLDGKRNGQSTLTYPNGKIKKGLRKDSEYLSYSDENYEV